MAQCEKINCRRRRGDRSMGVVQTEWYPGSGSVRNGVVGANRDKPRGGRVGEKSTSWCGRGSIGERARRKRAMQRRGRWIHCHSTKLCLGNEKWLNQVRSVTTHNLSLGECECEAHLPNSNLTKYTCHLGSQLTITFTYSWELFCSNIIFW